MMSLRDMVDASTGLAQPKQETRTRFAAGQDVVIKRVTSFSGPLTHELKAAKVVSVDKNSALVSVPGPGGTQTQKRVSLSQLTPATADMKRKMIQFSPQHTRML